ncbi:MAG TPA: carbon-nitrogen hydrolase family protein [Blastocatellia bacterium]|nr:carbon-nitrogen hydrolase family protein [Blastocatellia bacterium]
MKVAAYQAPLAAAALTETVELIREQVRVCESIGVEILCCPEAALGGLADYAADPNWIAISVDTGQLQSVLAPIASDKVTTIVGVTEAGRNGLIYNSAAIYHRGAVIGIYRKLHPAINKSVYSAGLEMPVFKVGGLTFGIIICNDSNYREPARVMSSKGATALFVPSNNGLPPSKAGPELVEQTRKVDVARAVENGVHIVRADVAGHFDGRTSYGSSEIVSPGGTILQSARQLGSDLIVAGIKTAVL